MKINWTDKDIRFIKTNFYCLTNQQLANALGLRLTSVRTKCIQMGFKRMDLEYWTVEQVDFLKANYKTIGDTELALIFSNKWFKNKGWRKKHIEKKRRYLELKRTKEEQAQIHERNVQNGCFALCSLKMWEKRGVTPVGEIRVWKREFGKPFLVIKTEDGFVNYAPWLWIKHHGMIPDQMIVAIKPGATEIVIENLELITRVENMSRNTIMRFPKELISTIHTLSKLKKTIQNGKKQN